MKTRDHLDGQLADARSASRCVALLPPVLLTAALASVMLYGCGHAAAPPHTPLAKHSAAPRQDNVFPQTLRGSRSLELGQLVLLLMPDAGEKPVGWDFRADSPIKWQSVAYTEVPETGYASRTGWVRVNVQGKTSKISRAKKLELGWTVVYSNEVGGLGSSQDRFLPPKLGVQRIEIKPGGDGDLACFGTGFYGCGFDEPTASLVKAGIHVKTLCSSNANGHVAALLLTHPGHRPTVMIWARSQGSGGASSWITLQLAVAHGPYDSSLCKE